VNLVEVVPHYASTNDDGGAGITNNNNLWVHDCAIFDPGGTFRNVVTVGTPVSVGEVLIQREIYPISWGAGIHSEVARNSVMLGGVSSAQATDSNNGVAWFGGRLTSPSSNGRVALVSWIFEGDVIVDTFPLIFGNNSIFAVSGSGLYIASGDSIFLDGYMSSNAAPIWGPGGITLRGTAKWAYTGTAVADFKQTGAWSLNGSASGSSFCAGTPAVWTQAIAITPTAIDAACSATGFGGTVFGRGGAVVANNF
jgi:hypothetical protein